MCCESSGRWVYVELWTAAEIDCSCACFEWSVHCLVLYLAEGERVIRQFDLVCAEKQAFIFDLERSWGTSWWMSRSKGEQHVNRGKMKAGITLKISIQWPSQWKPFSALWDLQIRRPTLWVSPNTELMTGRCQHNIYTELHWAFWWKSTWNSCPGS